MKKAIPTLALCLALTLLMVPMQASADNGDYPRYDSVSDPALPDTVLDEYADRVEIYAVRELDEHTFEVFLRNGIIVTLQKSAIVSYVSCMAGPDSLATLSCEVAAGEVDADGAKLVLGIFPHLVETLVSEGYTLYPMGTLENPPEDFPEFTAERVMRQDHMWHQPILYPWYEDLRGDDTKATTNLLFDFGSYKTRLEPITLEFIGPDYAAGDGMTVYQLNDAADAARHIVLARYIQPTDSAWALISAPLQPELEPVPVPPVPDAPIPPTPIPCDPTPVPDGISDSLIMSQMEFLPARYYSLATPTG